MTINTRMRSWALLLLCLGDLMIILDTTIVNVALPSIKADLAFTESSLVWVVNAYMLTFSGFLLLGGRLGDLYGHRRVFLCGVAVFTVASLFCGIAQSQATLIAARAIQGLGGAVVAAVALSLIITLFTEPRERAKAMGYFGFIAAGGGALGVFLGGLLTGTLDWHFVFLVNVPIGIVVFGLCFWLLPRSASPENAPKLDVAGAATVTVSLLLATYGILGGNAKGWFSLETIGFLGLALIFFGTFLFIERRASAPLVPLSIFKRRSVSVSSVIGVLWSASMFSWFFLSALYMQAILGYTPLKVGLSFLPSNIIMAAFSLGLSARIVMRYGTRLPLALGMLSVAAGLSLFAFAPEGGTFFVHVLPGMILLGLGAGVAFNPVLLAAMSEVSEAESGLASGVLNTSFMMGGSLGLAILASLAAAYTSRLIADGATVATATLQGYHVSFLAGTAAALFAALLAYTSLRDVRPSADQVVSH